MLKEVMSFWLDLGVDGFRIDSVGHFFEGDRGKITIKRDHNLDPRI
jgi:glycosidase